MPVFEVPSAVYGVSFVDITATGVYKGESLARNQQRNWETVLQIFGLQTQPIILQQPEEHYYDDDYFVGSDLFQKIGTRHQFTIQLLRPDTRFWVFAIGSEREDVLNIPTLLSLFDMIPVISGLRETITITPSIFQTSNPEFINIQFFPAPTIT